MFTNYDPASMPAPRLQSIDSEAALERLEFENGIAAVDIPWRIVRRIRFKNGIRAGGPRLDRLISRIRANGYQPFDPIVVRIGRKGRWIVVDGGHRLTAARQVDGEFWPNLFAHKVQRLYFIVCLSGRSFKGLKNRARLARHVWLRDQT